MVRPWVNHNMDVSMDQILLQALVPARQHLRQDRIYVLPLVPQLHQYQQTQKLGLSTGLRRLAQRLVEFLLDSRQELQADRDPVQGQILL